MWKKLFSFFAPPRPKTRIYIDSATFDPNAAPPPGQVVILTTFNTAGCIFERVRQILQTAAGVVVIDQGSTDGTPYLAGEAGAVVVLQRPGTPPKAAFREAFRAAQRISPDIPCPDLLPIYSVHNGSPNLQLINID